MEVGGARPSPIAIAASGDLHDVLSYRLLPDSLPISQALIHSLYPRNAIAWLWPFKICEDPDQAHTIYGKNPDVSKIVMEG
jgi:hypothetical protein